MTIAFQSSAFQSAFQQGSSPLPPIPLGGGGGFSRKKGKEAIDRKKLAERDRYQRELKQAYNALHGIESPKLVEAVRVYRDDKPTRYAPPVSRVDFEALSRNARDAKALLTLHAEMLEDEEDSFFMMVG